MIGTSLSHFQITAKLGEGGMGEVYRATDTKLGREVAIKVLPEAVATDPERLARFQREAKVLASLNHSHIAAIYSIESAIPSGRPQARLASLSEGDAALDKPADDQEASRSALREIPNDRTVQDQGESSRAQPQPVPAERGDSPPRPVHFLVMELVDGATLQELIEQGVPLEDALGMAAQVAEALEAAHERGIIHRDLKPANVKVTPDGKVKVLDFGLAKALDPTASWEGASPSPTGGASREGASPPPTPLSLSPTLTAQMTGAGIILGTAAYMSPEQARGQEADRRSDIWAFGALFYEMLTGKRLFAAETVSDTLARVLMQEPEWSEVEARIPAPIVRLLERCLERDVRQRLQAIGEARIALSRFIAHPEELEARAADADPTGAGAGSSLLRTAAPWLIVGALLGGLAAYWLVPRPAVDTASENLHFAIDPIEGGIAGSEDSNGLAISGDASKIVYVGIPGSGSGTSLYLKTSDSAEPRLIPDTEGARSPFFSPDGEWVAYFSDRELRKVSLLGGSSMSLAPAGDRRGGLWHPDGTIYFVPHSTGPLVKISSEGGVVEAVTALDEKRRERTHRWPSLVPGGKAILFTSDTHASTEYYDDARIEAVDLETGQRKVVLEGSSRAVATGNGFLLFARDGSLFKVPFDLDKLEVVGTPQLALQGVMTVVVSGAVQFAVADSGTLAYVPGGKTSEVYDLVWVTLQGETEIASSEQGVYFQASLSPQGDRVLLTSARQDAQDLWMLDLERQSLSRFTFEGNSSDPIWMPDGKRVVFGSNRDGTHMKPYIKSADGTGTARLLWDAPYEAFPDDVSSDGRWLVVEQNTFTGNENEATELWIVDLEGEREPFLFFEDVSNNGYASFSPDGRWLAYISSESGLDHVYVRPFPSADGKWQISQVPAREPRWSPDGARLFYRSIDGLKYVDVETEEGFRIGRPVLVEAGGIGAPFNRTLSFARDGERLLALRPHEEDPGQWRIHVILGWVDRLAEP